MEETYRATAKAVWHAEWRAYLERLERESLRDRGTARLVVEGEHQQLLWDLLRQPSRYVLVLSSQLSSEVVNPRLEEVLTERLRTGTRVVIAYGKGGKEPAERLARLARSYPQAADVFALGDGTFEGEVLVADDAVLIWAPVCCRSAASMTTSGRRRQPAQVGLLLRGGGAAQELLGDSPPHPGPSQRGRGELANSLDGHAARGRLGTAARIAASAPAIAERGENGIRSGSRGSCASGSASRQPRQRGAISTC